MADATRLSSAQRSALARLTKVAELRTFYLAGGTAVAFHLRHRVSRDLDLFSASDAIDLALVQQALVRQLPDVEVLAITDATLQITLEGIPIDLVRYRYAPLETPRVGPEDCPVAGLLDLAAMKLAAVAHRGLRRDFWDIHELLTRGGISVDAMLDAYRTRFGKSEPDLYHVIRALTFFDDANRELLMPAGMTAEQWQRISDYFAEQAPAILKRRLSTDHS